MKTTQNLSLPLLVQGQLNKDTTVNEALLLLDAVLNSALESLTPFKNPPTNLPAGSLILVAQGADEGFECFEGQIAFYINGWHFIKPKEGLVLWVKDIKKCVVFDGKNFIEIAQSTDTHIPTTDNTSLASELDILKKRISELEAITRDAKNKLIVTSSNSLFNHDGSDVRITLNKNKPEGTSAFIFQSSWKAFAEFGLIGGNNFVLKVLDANNNWKEVFVVDSSTGDIYFKQNVFTNGKPFII
jgi:hypothetical protein